jgi:hypothetical protein
MLPSLIAGEDHSKITYDGLNLVVETMLTTIKDSDTTLAGRLVAWICINNMSIFCLVGVSFGPFIPDIIFFWPGYFVGDV